ncbi:hypothetical protein O5O45_28640 [Hahella aquimaris]|uniref:hypothetical protein n=1 Tax=Hahella sp. HNIBRBA332 TaxID=3015983 RepID=UPI00273CAA9C|nr:hypothetical protein [Hahella sp. HNIBRBA332]WLQ13701.1 hypothetical protein O5O45_28640 [Hahella sp. HNIBRBA332]
MPVVKIKSLPLAHDTDLPRVLEGISKEFAESVKINVDNVYITWEYLSPGHYAHQGRVAGLQETHSHPVQVQLLTADMTDTSKVHQMFEALAEAISKRTHVYRENIFIWHSSVASGKVFDRGQVDNW